MHATIQNICLKLLLFTFALTFALTNATGESLPRTNVGTLKSSFPNLLRRDDDDTESEQVLTDENCADSLGDGFVRCGPEESDACYNPDDGHKCCSHNDIFWGCGSNAYCLVEEICCPIGNDPEACASEAGVSLPDDFEVKNNVPGDDESDVESSTTFEGAATTILRKGLGSVDSACLLGSVLALLSWAGYII